MLAFGFWLFGNNFSRQFFFSTFLLPSPGNGGDSSRTLVLGMMSRLFYHCAPVDVLCGFISVLLQKSHLILKPFLLQRNELKVFFNNSIYFSLNLLKNRRTFFSILINPAACSIKLYGRNLRIFIIS